MHAADLLELRDDLTRETQRFEQLVISLAALQPRLVNNSETVEAAALRLHSFYTGVERMLLLVSRGEGWHRRLLERMAMPTDSRPAILQEVTQRDLQEYLRFRHLVRNLYADELRAEPIQRLIEQLQPTWALLAEDIASFQRWLTAISGT